MLCEISMSIEIVECITRMSILKQTDVLLSFPVICISGALPPIGILVCVCGMIGSEASH